MSGRSTSPAAADGDFALADDEDDDAADDLGGAFAGDGIGGWRMSLSGMGSTCAKMGACTARAVRLRNRSTPSTVWNTRSDSSSRSNRGATGFGLGRIAGRSSSDEDGDRVRGGMIGG